jgi:hypothetical protein
MTTPIKGTICRSVQFVQPSVYCYADVTIDKNPKNARKTLGNTRLPKFEGGMTALAVETLAAITRTQHRMTKTTLTFFRANGHTTD